jgi:methanogenic corrinoid protein MtbC1
VSVDDRSALAATLTNLHDLPARVAAVFYARHPEWVTRFGAAGRMRCVEDTRFHISFLAGAVQTGRTEPFVEYVKWTAGVLGARGIDSAHLAEHLELLRDSLAGELPGGECAQTTAWIAAALAALAGDRPAPVEPIPPPLSVAYLKAALAGRRTEAYDLAQGALRAGVPMRGLYEELIDTQRRLGDLWAGGSISVAQEHLASAVTGWVVSRLYQHMPPRAPTKGRMIVAGVEGELHSLPAHFAADLLEMDGWDVTLVGTHVPKAAILSVVREQQPDAVGLSVTMPFNVPPTVSLIRDLRARAPELRILLGGRAVRQERTLAQELRVELAVS